MKPHWIVCLSAAAIALAGAAPCAAEEARLFVVSEPLHARVSLDGRVFPGSTPLVLRDLGAGAHEVVLEKPGFRSQVASVRIERGAVAVLRVELVSLGFRAEFAQERRLRVAEKDAQGRSLLLPEGTYSITRAGDALAIHPVYPHQSAIDGLTAAIPLLALTGGALTVYELASPRENPGRVPASVLAASIVTATLVGLDLVLHLDRQRFRELFAYEASEVPQADAASLYRRAQSLLEAGLLDEAAEGFAEILRKAPDSPLAPSALYNRARALDAAGRTVEASAELERLLAELPAPEVYDKGLVALARLRSEAGDHRAGLRLLEDVAYVDETCGPGTVEPARIEILERLAATDPSAAPRLIEALRRAIVTHPEGATRYRLALSRELARAGEVEQARAELRLLDSARLDPEEAREAEGLRRSLEER